MSSKPVDERSPRIQAIKKAYLARQASVEEIASLFHTSRGRIQKLAKHFRWPGRRKDCKQKEKKESGHETQG